jgi:8-oxo-dGTP pyrophosphatase MutT (NUDIX family)
VSSRPDWVDAIANRIPEIRALNLTRFVPPADFNGRESAVLILFGETGGFLDLVIIQRGHNLRNHAGQPAFPGGAIDDTDADAVAAALREANEEIGLDANSVEVLGVLPRLWVPASGFAVVPVVAWWREPHPVSPQDLEEVARVERIGIADLVNPENRYRVRHHSGFVGPAFLVSELVVWGFTGGLVDRLLAEFGFAQPWDETRFIPLADDSVGP